MFIKRVTKGFLMLVTMVSVMCVGMCSVLAARSTGMDSSEQIAYDYKLSAAVFPWGDVDGYTNSTFVLTENQYKAGYTGYSYLKMVSNSNKDEYITVQVSVKSGTNYAKTGTKHLDVTKNCTSTHKSNLTVSGKSYSVSKSLGV